ncbi:hypothetical protein OSTOST_14915 [Ostertagia ostertagi]
MITDNGRSDGDTEQNSSSSKPIVVWMQRDGSYVENIRNIVLRVKDPSKFGENVQGNLDEYPGPFLNEYSSTQKCIPNTSGELVDVRWESIMNLRPTIFELTHSRNPLSQLIGMLRRISDGEVDEFFSRLKMILSGHDRRRRSRFAFYIAKT